MSKTVRISGDWNARSALPSVKLLLAACGRTCQSWPMTIYRVASPLLRLLDPETAHSLTLRALEAGLVPAAPDPDPPGLGIDLWGRRFANPIGLAAGFDKDARVVDRMLALGFGFVEVGTVTPEPQPGNPKPRIFRLRHDRAVINRLGFNSGGLDAFVARLTQCPPGNKIVGANIGANRGSSDPTEDYAIGFRAVHRLVDYVTLNISSPNTPGLRDLQQYDHLASLLEKLVNIRSRAGDGSAQILVKIAPDLETKEAAAIAEIVLDKQIDGIIISNTTVARDPSLRSRNSRETGGLTGAPLLPASTALLADIYRLTAGRIPLIGVGGIASGKDAYEKIRAGASLIQLYTALVYEGPGLISRIKRELETCLARDGIDHVSAAVGTGVTGV